MTAECVPLAVLCRRVVVALMMWWGLRRGQPTTAPGPSKIKAPRVKATHPLTVMSTSPLTHTAAASGSTLLSSYFRLVSHAAQSRKSGELTTKTTKSLFENRLS